MKLIRSIKIQMTPLQRKRVERIDEEDFSLVKIKASKQLALEGQPHHDRYLERGIFSLKQYYAVALFDGKNPHAVSDSVDPFWHAHILDTERYQSFCNEAVGYFMHHKPHDPDNAREMDCLERTYQYTSRIYQDIFSWTDLEMNPKVLHPDRLICFHFDNKLRDDPDGLPLAPELQDVREYLATI